MHRNIISAPFSIRIILTLSLPLSLPWRGTEAAAAGSYSTDRAQLSRAGTNQHSFPLRYHVSGGGGGIGQGRAGTAPARRRSATSSSSSIPNPLSLPLPSLISPAGLPITGRRNGRTTWVQHPLRGYSILRSNKKLTSHLTIATHICHSWKKIARHVRHKTQDRELGEAQNCSSAAT